MKNIILSKQGFTDILQDLIKSGVTFEATETKLGDISIDFLGGY
jgi:hypothetical protein